MVETWQRPRRARGLQWRLLVSSSCIEMAAQRPGLQHLSTWTRGIFYRKRHVRLHGNEQRVEDRWSTSRSRWLMVIRIRYRAALLWLAVESREFSAFLGRFETCSICARYMRRCCRKWNTPQRSFIESLAGPIGTYQSPAGLVKPP